VDVAQLSLALYARQRLYTTRATQVAAQAWAGVDAGDISGTWTPQVTPTVGLVASGKRFAASGVTGYVSAMLKLQGATPDPVGDVSAQAFGLSAADGRPLGSLLYMPAVHAQTALADGATDSTALQVGLSSLMMIVATEVADAGRSALSAAMVSDRRTAGYVRVPGSAACSRCAILAGKWYSTYEGAAFERHPFCTCTAAAAADRKSIEPARTSPDAYFRSLTSARQDQVFTKAGAAAIRDGADMSQVVNARRGAWGMSPPGARLTDAEAKALRSGLDRGHLATRDVNGRAIHTTTEGTTRRGVSGKLLDPKTTPRLMPESIYQISADREEAITLLQRFGYIAA
jgi:hypothetical protein